MSSELYNSEHLIGTSSSSLTNVMVSMAMVFVSILALCAF